MAYWKELLVLIIEDFLTTNYPKVENSEKFSHYIAKSVSNERFTDIIVIEQFGITFDEFRSIYKDITDLYAKITRVYCFIQTNLNKIYQTMV